MLLESSSAPTDCDGEIWREAALTIREKCLDTSRQHDIDIAEKNIELRAMAERCTALTAQVASMEGNIRSINLRQSAPFSEDMRAQVRATALRAATDPGIDLEAELAALKLNPGGV
jgi:hypothetical protein